jgi:small multidrug resistance pump
VNSWLLLGIAIVLEVAGTTCMKLSDGFTRPLPSLGIVVFYAGAFAALTVALKRLEVSVAYAIWSAVGTALIALIGVVLFKESFTPLKAMSLLLIVAGVVGLQLDRA